MFLEFRHKGQNYNGLYIQGIWQGKQHYKASFRLTKMPLAAVRILPLVRDCAAGGRKVGK